MNTDIKIDTDVFEKHVPEILINPAITFEAMLMAQHQAEIRKQCYEKAYDIANKSWEHYKDVYKKKHPIKYFYHFKLKKLFKK